MSMFIGEALAGDGNEIAHIDLLIGKQRRAGRNRLRQCAGPAEQGALQSPGGARRRIWRSSRRPC